MQIPVNLQLLYAKEIYKGKFIPKNPTKYLGDFNSITYRSSYELKFMNWCDRSSSIKGWVSEEIAIPYRNPLDNKIRRYMVDFYIEVQEKDSIKKYLIEVKPERFTKAPQQNPITVEPGNRLGFSIIPDVLAMCILDLQIQV